MVNPPKPTKLKVLEGTHRPDRWGDPNHEMSPDGLPVEAVTLDGAAREHWDDVVPVLIQTGVATSADGYALTAMCEAWQLMRESHVLAKQNPTGKGERCSYLGYLKQWESFAARFGLTPSDRTRIRVNKPTGDELESKYG